MTPYSILQRLKEEQIELKLVDGRLLAPRAITPAHREIIAGNKTKLVSALLNQCHICNQTLELIQYETRTALSCPTKPLHYWEEIERSS